MTEQIINRRPIEAVDSLLKDEAGNGLPSESDGGQDNRGAGEYSDDRAWELVVRRYRPYLMRLAESYHIGDEAHDVVQNTFARLLTNGQSIRKPESLKYWLAAVARNECLAVIARRRREQPTENDYLAAALPPADQHDVDSNLLRQEDATYVRAALATLPPRQQQLLTTLVTSGDKSYRWVSEELGMPFGSIGPTRQRALARLRNALVDNGYG